MKFRLPVPTLTPHHGSKLRVPKVSVEGPNTTITTTITTTTTTTTTTKYHYAKVQAANAWCA